MDSSVCFLCLIISCFVAQASSCYCGHYPWGTWSACSKTCGGGTQFRNRKIVYDEYYWKNNCKELCTKHESQNCNIQSCKKVNCQLGDYGPWSDCDPCSEKQYQVRWVKQLAEFGGESCKEELSHSRICNPAKPCTVVQIDCKKKFKCQSGLRCIDIRLKCNGENDCGDNSDEEGCKTKPVSPRKYQPIPGAQLLGTGYNSLSGEARGDIFDNMFAGVKRKIITGPNRKDFFLPYNVENITFQVINEVNDLTSKSYEDMKNFVHDKDHQQSINSELSFSLGIPVLAHAQQNIKSRHLSSLKEAIKSSQHKDSKFIRIHNVISVSEFTMRKDNFWLSNGFLKALHQLPLEYNFPRYSRIFEDYGTHYISKGKLGGKYDLLFQYSSEKLKNSGSSLQQSINCLQWEVKYRIFFFITWTDVKYRCEQVRTTETYEGSFMSSSEKTISFIEGGESKYASTLSSLKEDRYKTSEDYKLWTRSVENNPVLVEFELKPITDLFKGIPCEVTKTRNLLKAYQEYLKRYDPCQCSPCENNGRTYLAGTECMCICQAGTYGDACQQRAPHYNSEAVDGSWNCWSSWSECDASRVRRRTRQCNNPPPSKGGKPCNGPLTQEDQCFYSLTESKGDLCINSEEFKKESDQDFPRPEGTCPPAEAPANGYIFNNKKWYNVAEEAEIACFDGFELQGYQFMRCLPDGTWEKEEVECI